jgi:hypothetical protein
MRNEKTNPDDWWWGVSPKLRVFWRDVMSLAKDLVAGEILELRFTGHSFAPALRQRRDPLDGRFKPNEQAPEGWWAGLSRRHRDFAQKLAELVGTLEREPNSAVEITTTGHDLRATLVMNFKRPVGGRAETN